MTKPIIAGLLLCAIALLMGILEKESAITADSLSKDPPVISKMIYPCETWIRQTGGGPPMFSCVNATQQTNRGAVSPGEVGSGLVRSGTVR